MDILDQNAVDESDYLRLSNRIQQNKAKEKIYVRRERYNLIAKNVLKIKTFKLIDGMNKEQQFNELEDYVNNCFQQELRSIGEIFPFQKYAHFIRTTSSAQYKFLALKILSRLTMSGKGKYDFFNSKDTIFLCDNLIRDQKFSPFIFTILINGAEYEDFGVYYLNSGICDFLLNLPVTPQLSMLVSNLTWFKSDYLDKFFELIDYILEDQMKKKDTRIDYSICCYAFKSIHHIYDWENIDPSIIEAIDERYTQIFYTLSPLLFDAGNVRILNVIFRYLSHLSNVPLEYGNLILSHLVSMEDMERNAKTIKLGMIPFINNAESWIQEYQEGLLFVAFTHFQEIPYDVKLTIFKAILLYYDCVNGVIDQYMSTVVDWCLTFIQDQEVTFQSVQLLIKISMVAKNDENIFSSICSCMDVFEDLVISDQVDEEVIALVENLIDIIKSTEQNNYE